MKTIVALLLVAASTAAAEPLTTFATVSTPPIAHGKPAAKPLETSQLLVREPGFAAKLPGTWKESTVELAVPTGTLLLHRYDGAPAPDLAYAVMYVDLGAKPDADAVLDSVIAKVAKAAGGTLDGRVDKQPYDTFPARLARIKLADGAVLLARFVVRDQLLLGIEAGDASARQDAQAIVDSFQPQLHAGVLIGTGHGYGVGGCGGGHRGRTTALPTLSIGQPVVTGDLDKAIVRRYIKRNANKLQYCYEKQLLAKPNIGGTITAAFTINASGRVETSKATGFDTDVAACVADVIGNIEFPKPKSDKVDVSYPFTFKPAAGGER